MNASSAKKRTTFEFHGEPGSEVFVAGSFNGWTANLNRMKYIKPEGKYRTALHLSPGQYEYKFIVNGAWVSDLLARECVQNSHGTINSVLRVEVAGREHDGRRVPGVLGLRNGR